MRFLILTFIALGASLASALTFEDYETIRQAFFRQIKKNYKNIDVATVLRLSFHDCVGGCDGCINMENPHNAGLQLAINLMEDVYVDVEAAGIEISRADLWAIGGRTAAEFGMVGMPGHQDWDESVTTYEESIDDFISPFPTFKYGRKDCETAPYTTEVHPFPTGHFNHNKVFKYFEKHFKFDANETVVIMGAHTYGRMALDNSGYHGPWVLQDGRTTFDNTYFHNLVMKNSVFNGVNFAENDATGDDARPLYRCKVAETGKNCGNMLVSDFALIYEFSVDDTTRFLNCDPSGSAPTCDFASTYDLVYAYAQDNELWLQAYYEVYDMMTANGAKKLTPILA